MKHFAFLFLIFSGFTDVIPACDLKFDVIPTASTFVLSGQVTAPVRATLTPTNPNILSGFQGSLILSLDGDCPTTAESLVSAISSDAISLETTAESGPVKLYPAVIGITGIAQVSWVEVSLNMTGQIENGGRATITATIDDGFVTISSLLSPAPERAEIVGINGTSVGESTLNSTRAQVFLTINNLNFTMTSIYQTEFNGAPLTGVNEYSLSGKMVLSYVVGCLTDCGSHGRCSQDDRRNLELPPSCECECGWSGVNCDTALGFCSVYSGAGIECPPPPANTTSHCAPDTSVTVPLEECETERQAYDSDTSSCECLQGWEGPGCISCSSDSACSAVFSDRQATCNTNATFTEHTAFKAYDCELAGTGLDDVVAVGTFWVACNPSHTSTMNGGSPEMGASSAASSLGSSVPSEDGFCEVSFSTRDDIDNTVYCRAELCNFALGTSRADCRVTTCECTNGPCPDIQGVLDTIDGNPCTISCDEAGVCTFDIQDFFVKLEAPCITRECLVPSFVANSADSYQQNFDDEWYNSVIAAIPLFVLLLLVAVLSLCLCRHRRYMFQTQEKSVLPFANGGDNDDDDDDVKSPQIQHGNPMATSTLVFKNLTCSVPLVGHNCRLFPCFGKSQYMDILRDVGGVAGSKECVGILGPSGSGKSTLLGILAGSPDELDQRSVVQGHASLDGVSIASETCRRRIAFVAQVETLLPTLTVGETVRMSALMRLPGSMPPEEVDARVCTALEELGLVHIKNSRVGGGGNSGIRGISGGERKRVAIGIELVNRRDVLLLDEPFSGLDSHSSLNLMRSLKKLAAAGRIVVLSLHSPSPALFNSLDRAYVLARGRCIFAGTPYEAEDTFAAAGIPCPVGCAIAEHILEVASDYDNLSKDLRTPCIEGQPLASHEKSNISSIPIENGGAWKATRPSFGRQMAVLFWRTGTDIIRNPALLLLHWIMALGMGIFVGCIFFDAGYDISGAQNRAGGVFFALAFFAFTSLTSIDLLASERKLVAREVRSGCYSPFSYLVAKAALDGLLLRVIPVFLYSAPFYPMMGLASESSKVALFLMVLLTFALAAGALSLAVAIATNSPGQAALVMNIVLLISLLVGGFFVNAASMPGWISWLRFLSIFYYGYQSLISNEMSDLLLNFVVEGYAAVRNVRGTTFLSIIGVDVEHLTMNIGVLVAFYFAFLLLGAIALSIRMPRGRIMKR